MFLLDAGVAVVAAVVLGLLFEQSPSVVWVLVAVGAAIAPDWDIIPYWFRHKKLDEWTHLHRDISHYPLLVIPAVGGATYLLLEFQFCILITTMVFLHYLVDTIGMGWGVRWLWPVSKNYFAFRPVGNDQAWKFHSWSETEQSSMVAQHGNPNWIGSPSNWLVGMIIFFCSLMILIIWTLNAHL